MLHSPDYIKGGEIMLTDKIEMLRLEACQAEAKAIMMEFRKALLRHFEVVNANATRLINSRWENANEQR